MMTSSGCTHYKVIDQAKAVVPIRSGENFKAPVDGWFVPDARYVEMREAIADRIEQMEKK